MKHADCTVHCYTAIYQVTSIKKDHEVRLMSSSPLGALSELHNLAQNTHHWTPDSYVVTFLKRDGFAPYELPATRNPDVRRRPREGNPAKTTDEMFTTEEMKTAKPSDTPIFALPVGAAEASKPSLP